MKELTFCIPVRINSDYRLRNLLTMLKFYSQQVGKAKYILLEADTEQRIKELPDIRALRHIFVKDTNPIFHRTHYINQMLRETDTLVAAVWDTDAIAPMPQLMEAYRAVLQGKSTMVYPYDGRYWNVGDYFTRLFHKNLNIKLLTDFSQPRMLICGYYSMGGAFLVNVKDYQQFGWENEHFVGWGPEDAERYRRMELLGEKPIRIPGSLFHLYHSRGVNSGDYDKQLAFQTKKEYCHICAMYPDELRRYVDSWEWIK